jgi:hypothetical protein
MIPAQLTLIDWYGLVRTVTSPRRSAIKLQVLGCISGRSRGGSKCKER